MWRWVAILAMGLGPGCTDFPQVDAALGAQGTAGDFPTLLPLDPLMAQADSLTISPEISTQMAGRVAALRRKADRLRAPILSRAERRRLEQAAVR